MALSETERRKPNFDEANSVGIVFGDGQTWYLPKPWLEIRPTFRGGRAVGTYPTNTYGPKIDSLIEAIGESEDDAFERFSAIASLAAYLLMLQYDLDDPCLDELLCFRLHDERSADWAAATIDVATGHSGPKRSRAGGG